MMRALLLLALILALGLTPAPPPVGPFVEMCDATRCTVAWEQQSTANGVYLLVDTRIVYEANSFKDRRHRVSIERGVWAPGQALTVWEVWTAAGTPINEARYRVAPMRVWLTLAGKE